MDRADHVGVKGTLQVNILNFESNVELNQKANLYSRKGAKLAKKG